MLAQKKEVEEKEGKVEEGWSSLGEVGPATTVGPGPARDSVASAETVGAEREAAVAQG